MLSLPSGQPLGQASNTYPGARQRRDQRAVSAVDDTDVKLVRLFADLALVLERALQRPKHDDEVGDHAGIDGALQPSCRGLGQQLIGPLLVLGQLPGDLFEQRNASAVVADAPTVLGIAHQRRIKDWGLIFTSDQQGQSAFTAISFLM
jgi:hypothetical protein